MSIWELILLFISGIAGLIVYIFPVDPGHHSKNIKYLLTFSGSYLLGVCIFDIFPEIYSPSFSSTNAFFLAAGFLIQVLLENVSGGLEHGHLHHHAGIREKMAFAALILHSVLEAGSLLFENSKQILAGIIIHNLPLSFFITIYLRTGSQKLYNVVLPLVIFSLSAPLAYLVYQQWSIEGSLYEDYTKNIAALSVGIIFHISTVILFESNKYHKIDFTKLGLLFLGLSVSFIANFLI